MKKHKYTQTIENDDMSIEVDFNYGCSDITEIHVYIPSIDSWQSLDNVLTRKYAQELLDKYIKENEITFNEDQADADYSQASGYSKSYINYLNNY